jgi:hypothetical protein
MVANKWRLLCLGPGNLIFGRIQILCHCRCGKSEQANPFNCVPNSGHFSLRHIKFIWSVVTFGPLYMRSLDLICPGHSLSQSARADLVELPIISRSAYGEGDAVICHKPLGRFAGALAALV